MTNHQKTNYALAIAFARGILDGEQLAQFLAIYRGGKMSTREFLISEYLDWVNNYLTPEVFGEHRGLSEDQAHQLIKLGRAVFESKHPDA